MQQTMPVKGDAPSAGTRYTSITAHTIGQLLHVAGAERLASNYRHENFLGTEKKELKVPLTKQACIHLLCMQNCPVTTLSPLPFDMNIYKGGSGTTTSF